MFCPNIKDECVGEKCRDWDAKEGKCKQSIIYISLMEYYLSLIHI